jgi:hypothetical protein
MWKRLNVIFFTFGGGGLGFYLQSKIVQRHKADLLISLPKLEAELSQCEDERRALEKRAKNELEYDV